MLVMADGHPDASTILTWAEFIGLARETERVEGRVEHEVCATPVSYMSHGQTKDEKEVGGGSRAHSVD